MNAIRSVCVYCGSSPGRDPAHVKAARVLGTAMAEAGVSLVYGGGTKGVMGALAGAVKAAGGHVTGVIPQFLIDMEATSRELNALDEVIVTQDMHERKHTMFERSDAFVALPGGIGTLEELIEIMTWSQLGRHDKPIAIANIAGFWNPLSTLLTHMRDEGYIHTAHQVRPILCEEPEEILPLLFEAASIRPAEARAPLVERM